MTPLTLAAHPDPGVISGEWLEQVINSKIERRIGGVIINTVALEHTRPGRVLYVVFVPESNLAPHMAADDRFYRRFNTQRLAMKEYEVRNLMRREQYPSREVVIAWRDSVINPLLTLLRHERQYLEKKKWKWDSDQGGLQGLHNLHEWSLDSGDKEEFLRLHPQVRAAAGEHDGQLTEVYARFNELLEQIKTSSFLLDLYKQYTAPEALGPLRDTFPSYMSHSQTPEAIFGNTSEEQRLLMLTEYVITDAGNLMLGANSHAPFWNTYKEKFKTLTKYPPLRLYEQKADDARTELLARMERLRDVLTKTRGEVCRQHGLPVETPPTPTTYITPRDGLGFKGW